MIKIIIIGYWLIAFILAAYVLLRIDGIEKAEKMSDSETILFGAFTGIFWPVFGVLYLWVKIREKI